MAPAIERDLRNDGGQPHERRLGGPDPRLPHAPIETVSVVIPAHDAATTIVAQLEALRAQDTDALSEVIVVDSCSTDATAQVVERIARTWPKLRLDRTDRPGANTARNLGVSISASPAVLLCDADDVVGDEWIASMIDALQAHDLVRGRYSLARLNDADTIAARGDLSSTRAPESEWSGGIGGCCAIRKRAWELLDGFAEHYVGADDVEIFWRGYEQRLRIGYAPDAVVHYRLREGYAALFRQQHAWASSRALLFKEFRGTGFIARRTAFAAAKGWAWLVVHVPDAASDEPARRGRWVRAAAGAVGRLRGSIRYRVWYP